MMKFLLNVKSQINLMMHGLFNMFSPNKKYIDYFVESLDEAFEMQEFCIECRSLNEYREYLESNYDLMQISKYQKILEFFYNKIFKWNRVFKGYCDVCKKPVKFNVNLGFDSRHGGKNWRETLECPCCGFNNRIRAILNLIVSDIQPDDNIYITEFVTPFYKYLRTKFNNITGSEFLGDNIKSGTIVNGILHEDLCNLSFESCTFDIVISLDVLEHVADYKKALINVFRILRTNGRFIFSVPFIYESDKDEKRSIKKGNNIVNLMEPEIHGNPVDKENGALVFTIPSWEMINFMKDIGFYDAYALFYYSRRNGYLACADGMPQVLFVAIK